MKDYLTRCLRHSPDHNSDLANRGVHSLLCPFYNPPTKLHWRPTKSMSSSFDAPDASSVVILKLHCAQHPLPQLWPVLNIPRCNRTQLAGSHLTLCYLQSLKSLPTAHSSPLFQTQPVHSAALGARLLSSGKKKKPWQTQRIMLRFLPSAAFSKWIPISKRTRRTSRGGKITIYE